LSATSSAMSSSLQIAAAESARVAPRV
jgi:hypothetical protein